MRGFHGLADLVEVAHGIYSCVSLMETLCFNAFIAMYACFSNNGGEVTKEKIDASVHSGQTIMRQMVLLTMFKLKKMKDREFSTKKLAESIKVLRKASGVNVKEFCKSIHMTERSYYSALKSKLTI